MRGRKNYRKSVPWSWELVVVQEGQGHKSVSMASISINCTSLVGLACSPPHQDPTASPVVFPSPGMEPLLPSDVWELSWLESVSVDSDQFPSFTEPNTSLLIAAGVWEWVGTRSCLPSMTILSRAKTWLLRAAGKRENSAYAAPALVQGHRAGAGLVKRSQAGRAGALLSHSLALHRSWCVLYSDSASQLSVLPGIADWCILIRVRVNYIGLWEPNFFTMAWGKWED